MADIPSVFPYDNPEVAVWAVKNELEMDSVTGLPNRQAGIEKLRRMLDRAKIGGDLSILFLDLDRFKPINNKYGHKYGDQILKDCAEGIRRTFRPTDLVFRYGGDEIVVAMSDYYKDDSDQEADRNNKEERIRNAIQDTLSMRDDYESHSELADVGVTLGIAYYENEDTPESIIDRADITQYNIKHRKHTNGY